MANAKSSGKKLLITLTRSLAKRLPNHIANAAGLGLRRMNQTVELQDTPEIRGMINRVSHLVRVEEVGA